MTDNQKQKIIDKVIHDFDFEKVRALMLVMDWTSGSAPEVPVQAVGPPTTRGLMYVGSL